MASTADSRSPFDFLTRLAQSLTVLGALLYGFLAIAYAAFYNALGINPEDVGLNYVTTLTRSAGLVTILLLALFIIALAFIARRASINVGPFYPFAADDIGPGLRRVLSAVIAIALIVMVAYLIRLPPQAASLARQVEQNQPVRPIRFLGLTMLAIRAEPARVTWLSDLQQQPRQLIGYSVLYLGQANGNAVFWDPRGRHTIIIPTSNLLIEIG